MYISMSDTLLTKTLQPLLEQRFTPIDVRYMQILFPSQFLTRHHLNHSPLLVFR